jgi:pyruvate dehydrogenase E2 component (dihydrolipoamide acetyltransferase)
MAKLIGLPRLSPTMEEGTLSRWLKHEGDAVNVDDVLAEVETDKATMEWHSFDSGTLLKILAEEGTLLAPDDPVAILGAPGENIDELLLDRVPRSPAGAEAAAPPSHPSPSNEPNGDREAKEHLPTRDGKPDQERDESSTAPPKSQGESNAERKESSTAPPESQGKSNAERDESSTTPPESQGKSGENATDTRLAASPSVRRLAREHGLDLGDIQGSGPSGRIVQRDLADVIESRSKAPPTSETPPHAPALEPQRPSPKTIPMNGSRRTIARRLTEAKQTIPHYYVSVDIDASPLRQGLRDLNATQAEGEPRVSVNDVILRACAQTLRLVPEVNVSLKSETILYHQVVDIAVAIALEDGLTVPVVRDADAKGVLAIGREVRNLVKLAHEKKLKPEHLAGGTFCVSNLGMYDIHSFAAIINPPQAAILAVGAIREEPVIVDGQVRPGAKLHLTLSCDHRLIDGAVGARWLRTLGDLLETPLRMLL